MTQGESGPANPDEEWQEDRPIFDREDKDHPGDHKGPIYVSQSARKHWSDKNPRKFTPDVALKIIQFIGVGCFNETAAAAAGISKDTFYRWLRVAERGLAARESGQDDDGDTSTEEMRAWKRLLDEAEANAEARAVGGIQQAGAAGAWQAYAWFLERKHPDRWGRRDTTVLANPDGTPLGPTMSDMTPEAKIKMARALIAAAKKPNGEPEPS